MHSVILDVLCQENDELFPGQDTEVLKQCVHHGWKIIHGSIEREELNDNVMTIEAQLLFRGNVTLHFLISQA
jgi:hypothetical protein